MYAQRHRQTGTRHRIEAVDTPTYLLTDRPYLTLPYPNTHIPYTHRGGPSSEATVSSSPRAPTAPSAPPRQRGPPLPGTNDGWVVSIHSEQGSCVWDRSTDVWRQGCLSPLHIHHHPPPPSSDDEAAAAAEADTINLEALAEQERARAAVAAALAAFPSPSSSSSFAGVAGVQGEEVRFYWLVGLMMWVRWGVCGQIGVDAYINSLMSVIQAATSVPWEGAAAAGGGEGRAGGTRRPSVRTDSVSIYAHM